MNFGFSSGASYSIFLLPMNFFANTTNAAIMATIIIIIMKPKIGSITISSDSACVILVSQCPTQHKSLSDEITALEHTSVSKQIVPLRASQSGITATVVTIVRLQLCCNLRS